jgi:hypothetical protein
MNSQDSTRKPQYSGAGSEHIFATSTPASSAFPFLDLYDFIKSCTRSESAFNVM